MAPSVCMGGTGPALHSGTKAGVSSIRGTATLALPSHATAAPPPLGVPVSRLFIPWRCPELQTHSEPETAKEETKPPRGEGRAGSRDDNNRTTSRQANQPHYTHLDSYPSTYFPPTSHMPDFIRHPEKKTGNMLLAWKMLPPHSLA